jgi:hypothetical protein
MARSAFSLIADAHHEMGQPGLLHCIEVLGNNYDELDPEMARAYDEFYTELMAFVNLQVAE